LKTTFVFQFLSISNVR